MIILLTLLMVSVTEASTIQCSPTVNKLQDSMVTIYKDGQELNTINFKEKKFTRDLALTACKNVAYNAKCVSATVECIPPQLDCDGATRILRQAVPEHPGFKSNLSNGEYDTVMACEHDVTEFLQHIVSAYEHAANTHF